MNTSKPQFRRASALEESLRRQALQGRVKIALLDGGAFQDAAQTPDVTGCHMVLYVDVPAEMEAVNPAREVIRLTLADRQTIGTLTKLRCSEALKKFLGLRPGVNVVVGLGQLRPIGKLAIEALLADPTFSHFMRSQILEELLVLTNANLQEVELISFSSGAGGTGGAIANLLMGAIFSELKNRSTAVIHLRNARVGPLTFVGVGQGAGDRIPSNAAATLAEDLWLNLVLPRHEREVRSLWLAELPMLKGDKAARARYAALLAQALSSRSVRARLDLVAPNRATQSEFGNITILNTNFWTALNARPIAEEAVRQYVPGLEALLNLPARPGQSAAVRPVARFVASDATPTVEDLMAEVRESHGIEPQDFANRVLAPTEKCISGTVTATLSASRVFDLGPDMLALLRTPVATRAEWQDKLEVLTTTQLALASALISRAPESRRLEQLFQKARQQLQRAMWLLFPKGLRARVASFLANPATKLKGLQNAIVKCRELSLQGLKLASEIDLLSEAKARVEEILATEHRRLESLLALLRPFQRVAGYDSQALVECVPLDDILPRLVALAEQGKSGHDVLRLLETSVVRVTLAGLAAIVGAREPQPSSIAQRLLGTEAPVRSPRWGGETPRAGGMRMVVLPPTDPGVVEAIQAHAALVDGDTLVTTSDTAQGGCNVVELEVHFPRELQEILTRFLEAGLKDAAAAPEVHVAEDDASLPWLLNRLNAVPAAA